MEELPEHTLHVLRKSGVLGSLKEGVYEILDSIRNAEVEKIAIFHASLMYNAFNAGANSIDRDGCQDYVFEQWMESPEKY